MQKLITFLLLLNLIFSTSANCLMSEKLPLELRILENSLESKLLELEKDLTLNLMNMKDEIEKGRKKHISNLEETLRTLQDIPFKLQELLHNEKEIFLGRFKEALMGLDFKNEDVNATDLEESLKNLFRSHQMTLSEIMMSKIHSWNKEICSNHFHLIRPFDCCEILRFGREKSGVYKIFPSGHPVEAYCDMDTDGGGWTVFLTRNATSYQSQQLNFTRIWKDYKKGFGNVDAEYWLGNEALHRLTRNRKYTMRMEAKDGEGKWLWSAYSNFKVDSEISKYKITLSDFDATSTIYEGFLNIDGLKFTTIDEDNDQYIENNCATLRKGGWWYKDCSSHNPVGIHGGDHSEGLVLRPTANNLPFVYPSWLKMKLRSSDCG